MIRLGSKVQDKITGFCGLAVGRTKWLYEGDDIGILPGVKADGNPAQIQWFKETRIEPFKYKEIGIRSKA